MPEDGIDRFIRQSEEGRKIFGEEPRRQPKTTVDLVATVKEMERQKPPILEFMNLKEGDMIQITTTNGEKDQQQSFLVSKAISPAVSPAPHPSQGEEDAMTLTALEGDVVPSELKGKTIIPTGSSFGGSALRVGGLLSGSLMEYWAECPDGWVSYTSHPIKSFEVKRKVDSEYRTIPLNELNKLEPVGNLQRFENVKKLYDEMGHEGDGKHLRAFISNKRLYEIRRHPGTHLGEFLYQIEVYEFPKDVWAYDNTNLIHKYKNRYMYTISNGDRDGTVAILIDTSKDLLGREGLSKVWLQVDRHGNVSFGRLDRSYNSQSSDYSVSRKQAEALVKEHIAVEVKNGQIRIKSGKIKIEVPQEPDIKTIQDAAYEPMGRKEKGFGGFLKRLKRR